MWRWFKLLKATDDAYKRMIVERVELQKKVEALESFLREGKKGNLDNVTKDDLDLLEEQLHYMNGYLRILGFRIKRINDSYS